MGSVKKVDRVVVEAPQKPKAKRKKPDFVAELKSLAQRKEDGFAAKRQLLVNRAIEAKINLVEFDIRNALKVTAAKGEKEFVVPASIIDFTLLKEADYVIDKLREKFKPLTIQYDVGSQPVISGW